jgi:hypothetical protein
MREANSPDQDCVPVCVQLLSLTEGRAVDRLQAWNATLSALEAMIVGQATGTSVSFDEVVHRSNRGPLAAVSRLWSIFLAPRLRRLCSWRSGRWDCSASELVPALLTFVERPLRIVVIGRTADELASAGVISRPMHPGTVTQRRTLVSSAIFPIPIWHDCHSRYQRRRSAFGSRWFQRASSCFVARHLKVLSCEWSRLRLRLRSRRTNLTDRRRETESRHRLTVCFPRLFSIPS